MFLVYTVWACLKAMTQSTTLKDESSHKNHYDDHYNLVYSDTTKFQLFEFLVYTVWACLKAVTPYNTLKEEWTDKNYLNDNYNLL